MKITANFSFAFAFVTMATAEQARSAAEKLNGTLLAGRVLKVSEASSPR